MYVLRLSLKNKQNGKTGNDHRLNVLKRFQLVWFTVWLKSSDHLSLSEWQFWFWRTACRRSALWGNGSHSKSQQFHDVVSRTLELFPNKEILNTVLVPSLRPMAADLNTNFRFVCELKNLIKPYTKVGLYQNTVSEDICSWCRSNLLHAPVRSLGFVKHNTKSYIWALHLLR